MALLPHDPDCVLLSRHDDARRLDRATRRGELERVEYGAYLPVLQHDVAEWEAYARRHRARCIAAMDRLGRTTVLSHLSAAAVHGLWGPVRNDTVHVTQRFTTNGRDIGSPLVRHQRPLAMDEVTVIEGLRVTALDRTVIDCVCMLPHDWGFAIADSALRRLTSADRTAGQSVARRAARIRRRWLADLEERGPRRGRRRAREILARADPLSESAGESRLRCIAVAAGLPTPVLQMPVHAGGHTYFADFGWAVQTERDGVVPALVEFDGRGKYDVPGALDAQRTREEALRRVGARIARFDGDDLLVENHHLALNRLFDLVPELLSDLRPVVHLNAQPARPRRRVA